MQRHYPDASELIARLARAQFDPPSWQTLCVQAHLMSLNQGITELASLEQLQHGRIQVLPHQIDAVMTALNRMRGRAILADEVGLGKTIEAGLILKECLVRRLVRRVLILTPAPLTTQWRGELASKFGEAFVVGSGEDEQFDGWEAHDRLIVSLDTAKHPANAEAIARHPWDMLIVDEAHRLKNSATAAYQFVRRLAARYKLFLTATPVQNSLFELYNLVNLLSEGLLGTQDRFRARHIEDPKGRVLKDAAGLAEALGRIMIRHRRAEVGIRFVERQVETLRLAGTAAERELHDAVVEHVARGLGAGPLKGKRTLAFIRLSRLMSSSPQALIRSLDGMSGQVTSEEVAELGAMRELAMKVGTPSKLEALRTVLDRTSTKAIVFTGFYETQDYLAERLTAAGRQVVLFNGKMTQKAKDEAVERFRATADVLLCTDAGSEGVNLQFCHVLVNYDLPWNPMRVEQRIGRVHRIGQTQDVLIVNLAIQDTIEDYVLQILEQKIALFTQAVGETDLILANLRGPESLEVAIAELIARSRQQPLAAGFAELGEQLAMARTAADQIRAFDARTLALLDLSALGQ